MTTNPVHTAGNAVPPLDADLQGLIDDLTGIHPGLDLALDGLRHLLLDRHTLDTTQTLIASLAGGSDATNLVALIGQAIARLAHPDANPALRGLPMERQKLAQLHGEVTAHVLAHPDLAGFASETSAAITSH
ncbi:hypothetical protein [Streptomyces sp. NPDC001658]